jgi:hypothetical protein
VADQVDACHPSLLSDTEEIIATVHGRRAPMMSATAGLQR